METEGHPEQWSGLTHTRQAWHCPKSQLPTATPIQLAGHVNLFPPGVAKPKPLAGSQRAPPKPPAHLHIFVFGGGRVPGTHRGAIAPSGLAFLTASHKLKLNLQNLGRNNNHLLISLCLRASSKEKQKPFIN